jgi:pimeloyl-ACP methyl ester carboxylesterase
MKVLMLHGYTQTGDNFRRKIRRLENRLRQTNAEAEFVYADGPVRLGTHDIPGFHLATSEYSKDDMHQMSAWFDLRSVTEPPNGLDQSLDSLAALLKAQGPFDGVVAFSQGTIIGAILASLLQGNSRRRAYESAAQRTIHTFRYPDSFSDLKHPPLKFALFYASQVGTGAYSDWLYESPRIETRFCHFFGLLDSMVSHEQRDVVSVKLGGGVGSRLVFHDGGHFVPTDDGNVEIAARFVEECMRAVDE